MLILGLIDTNDGGKLDIGGRDDFLLAFGMSLIWPITILVVIPYMKWQEDANNKLRYKADNIKRHTRICDNKHDRSLIVAVDEEDLKTLLRAHRKGLGDLNPAQVEIIRDELMHRNAERSLLR